MGNHTRLALGYRRHWSSIAFGALVLAALAGCGTVKPAAGDGQQAPIGSPAAASATPLAAATARMPSTPSATGTKASHGKSASHSSSTASPSGSTGTNGSSNTGGSSGSAGASPSSPSSASSGSAGCVTSAQQNDCGPYNDPQIEGAAADPSVTNDIWNPISGWQQTLFANSPGDWHTVVTGPTGNTAVVSYPDVTTQYGDKALSSFPALYSSFSEDMHAQSGTTGEAAFDLWLNNWGDEVMIMHDLVNIDCPDQQATEDFGGSHGVPVQQWKLCKNGSELIWELAGAGEQTGSVDILSMLTWLVSHGYLPQAATLTAIDYGFEVCSTGGEPETFTVSSYSVST